MPGCNGALLFAHTSGRPMGLRASPYEQKTLLIEGRCVVFHHLTSTRMQMVHFDSGNLVRVLVHVRVWVRFDLQGELRKVGVQLRSSLGRRLF